MIIIESGDLIKEENEKHDQGSKKISPEEYDAIVHRWYVLGQIAEKEDMASSLRAKSGDSYARRLDGEAKLYRDLADGLDEEAREARFKYMKAYDRGT